MSASFGDCHDLESPGRREEDRPFCLVVRSEWQFNLFCVCLSSSNLGIFHVRRPVSRDRRILVMELKAGKATHIAY